MSELACQLQALLFVAEQPLDMDRLAQLTGKEAKAVQEGLDELQRHLEGSGLQLSHHAEGWRLVTAPATAEVVRQLQQDQAASELSRPALETLAIIAYRGPISRNDIEAIRGVGSEVTLRNLLSRELIQVSGRSAGPPRYNVSPQFLDLFGLRHVDELPPLNSDGDAT